jgi:uncharacterized protein
MSFIKNIFLPVIGFAFISCNHLYYYPTRQMHSNPKDYSLDYEDVYFKTSDDIKLNGWIFKSNLKESKGTIVQFHGNAENISTHYLSLVWLIRHGYNLITFDYRGYGKSDNNLSIDGIYNDSIAAIEFALKTFPNDRIIIWGQSIGGIIAARALMEERFQDKISTFIIEASFSSYKKMAQNALASFWLTWPIQHISNLLISDKYAIKGKWKKLLSDSFLVIHGTDDNIVPFKFGEEIFRNIKNPKNFLKVTGGTHIDSMFVENGKYRNYVLDYLERIK